MSSIGDNILLKKARERVTAIWVNATTRHDAEVLLLNLREYIDKYLEHIRGQNV